MRKDKGLNGDLDRLPMLTWIMFLKFLDDLEVQRETEAELAGKKFERATDPPYRWRDWAANPAGITGDGLISFVNNEEAVLPDGSRGARSSGDRIKLMRSRGMGAMLKTRSFEVR
jgi:type I restriction enzyme M protein